MTNAAMDISTQNGMDELAAQFHASKLAENAAREARIEAESRLIEAIGLKQEGSLSVHGDYFKVTTTQPITRTINKEALPEVSRDLSPDIFDALFIPKASLNVKFFKELQQHNPEAYKIAAYAVEAKPGKAGVKVEMIK
ncbi:MAG: DUF7173 family protein [Spongiibacteraceae bacterium]